MSDEESKSNKLGSGESEGSDAENASGSALQSVSSAGEFERQLNHTLEAIEVDLRAFETKSALGSDENTWAKARVIVSDFQPVPDFIWRVSHYVLGNPGRINAASEGLLFGLRNLMGAIAKDDLLGNGVEVSTVKAALKVVASDVIAASSVIYAICRKLRKQEFERIWRPVLDDALLRARIGYHVGLNQPEFGGGRGMLAGFAGRIGLVILIAGGTIEQAREALERLATGSSIKEVGIGIYGCDPLQVSAFTLSAAGCGREAALGTVAFSTKDPLAISSDSVEQQRWAAAFMLTEQMRIFEQENVDERAWALMNMGEESVRDELAGEVKRMIRRGHGWRWFFN
jgi:hypothetical protein